MRIGIMTGGGDAPGLNGIIESASRVLLNSGHEVIGIEDGFEGIFEGRFKNITLDLIEGIHAQAGTLLGTSNKCGTKGREKEFIEKYKKLNVEGLIVAGGDGTFSGLNALKSDINMIGVPKTIDNDLSGTDMTFGYDTACTVVAESADSLRATADAHKRIIIVETMGRTAGWIALGGGLSGYADMILIPERPFDKKEFIQFIKNKKSQGRRGLIIVVSEGARAKGEEVQVALTVESSPEAFRLGGIAQTLARFIEKEVSWECRHVVLGHLQRARYPSVTDRFLTLAMGVTVGQLVENKKWGMAAVYREGIVTYAPITDLMGPTRLVPDQHRWISMAQKLGIFI